MSNGPFVPNSFEIWPEVFNKILERFLLVDKATRFLHKAEIFEQVWKGIDQPSRDCTCMLHIISLRAQISQNVKYWYICMKYVTYWYQFFTRCKELVSIRHSVKFAKCEICGSTKLTGKRMTIWYSIACASINTHYDVYNGTRGLNVVLSLHLYPYVV